MTNFMNLITFTYLGFTFEKKFNENDKIIDK